MKKLVLLTLSVLSVSVFLSANNSSKDKIPEECKQKRYCSQMSSCKEAKYYLKLCGKYARMDGNNDGVPCERQWCH